MTDLYQIFAFGCTTVMCRSAISIEPLLQACLDARETVILFLRCIVTVFRRGAGSTACLQGTGEANIDRTTAGGIIERPCSWMAPREAQSTCTEMLQARGVTDQLRSWCAVTAGRAGKSRRR